MEADIRLSKENSLFAYLRKRLDQLGYLQPFGFESSSLVERLLVDLLRTTECLKNSREAFSSQQQEKVKLELLLEPYKKENSRLTKENLEIHKKNKQISLSSQEQIQSYKRELEEKRQVLNDLKFYSAECKSQIDKLNENNRKKAEMLGRLQDKHCPFSSVSKTNSNNTNAAKKQVENRRKPVLKGQRLDMNSNFPIMEGGKNTALGKNVSSKITLQDPYIVDMLQIADRRINQLQDDVIKLINQQRSNIYTIDGLRKQVADKNDELSRMHCVLGSEGRSELTLPGSGDALKQEVQSKLITQLNTQLEFLQQSNRDLAQKLRSVHTKRVVEDQPRSPNKNPAVTKSLTNEKTIKSGPQSPGRKRSPAKESRNSPIKEGKAAVAKDTGNSKLIKNLQDEKESLLHELERVIRLKEDEARRSSSQQSKLSQIEKEKDNLEEKIRSLRLSERELMMQIRELQQKSIDSHQDLSRTRKPAELTRQPVLIDRPTSPLVYSVDACTSPIMNKTRISSPLYHDDDIARSRTNRSTACQADPRGLASECSIGFIPSARTWDDYQQPNFPPSVCFAPSPDRSPPVPTKKAGGSRPPRTTSKDSLLSSIAFKSHRCVQGSPPTKESNVLPSCAETVHYQSCSDAYSNTQMSSMAEKTLFRQMEERVNDLRAAKEEVMADNEILRQKLKLATETHKTESQRLNAEIDSLVGEIQKVNAKHTELRINYAGTNKLAEEFRSQMDDQIRQTTTAHAQAKQHEQTANQLKLLMEQNSKWVKDCEKLHKMKSDELEAAERTIRDLREQISDLGHVRKEERDEALEMRQILLKIDDSSEVMRLELQSKSDRISELQLEMNARESEIRRLLENLHSVEAALTESRAMLAHRDREINDLAGRYQQSEEDKMAADRARLINAEDGCKLTKDLDTALKDNRILQENVNSYQNTVRELKRQLAEVAAERTKLQAMLRQKDAERFHIVEQCASLSKNEKDATRMTQMAVSDAEAMRALLDAKEEELRQARFKLNLGDKENQMNASTCRDLEAQLELANRTLYDAKMALRGGAEEKQKLHEEVRAVRRLCTSLDKQRKDLTEQLAEREQKSKQDVQAVERLQSEVAILKAELSAAKIEIAGLEDLLARTRIDQIEATSGGQSKDVSISELQRRIDKLQQHISDQDRELFVLRSDSERSRLDLEKTKNSLIVEKFDKERLDNELRIIRSRHQSTSTPSTDRTARLQNSLTPIESTDTLKTPVAGNRDAFNPFESPYLHFDQPEDVSKRLDFEEEERQETDGAGYSSARTVEVSSGIEGGDARNNSPWEYSSDYGSTPGLVERTMSVQKSALKRNRTSTSKKVQISNSKINIPMTTTIKKRIQQNLSPKKVCSVSTKVRKSPVKTRRKTIDGGGLAESPKRGSPKKGKSKDVETRVEELRRRIEQEMGVDIKNKKYENDVISSSW